MSLHPIQKYKSTDLLFFRKNDHVFSGYFKYVKMDKGHVYSKDGRTILENYDTPRYWIDGIWYKESELSLTPEGLLK